MVSRASHDTLFLSGIALVVMLFHPVPGWRQSPP